MPSISVVPLRKAAPKRTHLTQERTEPFLDNSAAGFITVGNMTSCPGSSCPVPCLPVPGRSLRAGRTCLENKMEGALGERKPCTEYHPVHDCMWVSARNRCGNGRRRSWDCTHTPRYTCLQSILPPLVPPSLSQFCQPAASQRIHLQHLSLPTPQLQHCSTEVPNTYVYLVHHSHTHAPGPHCALFDKLFLSNTTAAWPKDCKMAMHIPALPISPISSSRFTRVGTEMTYSNICDPARPPAESQRSITSQILIPRKGREKKKNALRQLTNPLLLCLCYRAVYNMLSL